MESNFSSMTPNAAFAQANNHLALNLHRQLAREGGNVFFSPFSLSIALAMLYWGTRNETAREMRHVLGYDSANITDDNLLSSFNELLSKLDRTSENYVLSYANSLLYQSGFAVKEEYKSAMNEIFRALMVEVDFTRDSEKVVKQINEWVKTKTNNMIPQLLKSLDPMTVMVILNAVYFKGAWSKPFDERFTGLQNFYNNGKRYGAKEVEMMYHRESFFYLEKETFKALKLPYEGGEVAMLVFLPHSRNGLRQLERQLSSTFVQDIESAMYETTVEVALPKFRLEYSKSMKKALQALGMNLVFQNGADLGGISDSKELKVSDIIHKAAVVVNEEGSEAAAVTAILVTTYSLSFDPTFIVDHPFMFVIYDTKSSHILFMGKVREL
ncbi:leukocyte elastase inhibitor-like isoform X2 [Stegodyphus dumicola]|uniref:leukocyte elastase inhibitor-like isoform X2 n=1 Tax=Stegodyphus dumicola TaxID=202533 RepID=UPI0015AA449B|nr:leukocyte elastase inhibitor-like isoform X2 [Stegodyphus dumicola]